jgi:hypothetical protein
MINGINKHDLILTTQDNNISVYSDKCPKDQCKPPTPKMNIEYSTGFKEYDNEETLLLQYARNE